MGGFKKWNGKIAISGAVDETTAFGFVMKLLHFFFQFHFLNHLNESVLQPVIGHPVLPEDIYQASIDCKIYHFLRLFIVWVGAEKETEAEWSR